MRSFRRSLPAAILLGMVLVTLCWNMLHENTSLKVNSQRNVNSGENIDSVTSLLLVAGGRTGSSFTSTVISRHPDVFYTSEPLHGMPQDIYDHHIGEATSQKSQTTINAFLTCQFDKVDPKLFGDILFDASKSTKKIHYCLLNRNLTGFDHVACFVNAKSQCEQKRVRFVKSIRYRVEWLQAAMEANPGLKVLYLVRDFRATLYSQAKTFRTFDIRANCEERANNMCTNVLNDYLELERLEVIYPGRLLVIRYEDGCLDPVAYSRTIYTFAGLPFTANIQAYVDNITNSKKSHRFVSGVYKTERSDAIKTMNNWRNSAHFDLVQKIDHYCAEANKMFGYKDIDSEKEMKSTNQSTVVQPKLDDRLYHIS